LLVTALLVSCRDVLPTATPGMTGVQATTVVSGTLTLRCYAANGIATSVEVD